MRGASVTTSRRPFGATTLLIGTEIEPPDRRKAPVTDRSAAVVPIGDVVAVAPDAPAAAAPAVAAPVPLAAPAAGAAVVVDAVVVGVVVVVPVVVVSVGNETVGRLTGNDGTVIVVGRSPSAAAVGGCAARRKPSEPAATSAEICSPVRTHVEPACALMERSLRRRGTQCSRPSVGPPGTLRYPFSRGS